MLINMICLLLTLKVFDLKWKSTWKFHLNSEISHVRWESSPWTACSTSCGGGVQSRSVSCVEEDMQGNITPTDEWKCLYASKTSVMQPCNTFDCPTWIAQEWSPVINIYSVLFSNIHCQTFLHSFFFFSLFNNSHNCNYHWLMTTNLSSV